MVCSVLFIQAVTVSYDFPNSDPKRRAGEKRDIYFFLHFPSCNGNSNNREALPNILSTTKPWLISCEDISSMTGFKSTKLGRITFSSLLFRENSFSTTFFIWNDIAIFSFEKHGTLLEGNVVNQKLWPMIHSHVHPCPSKVDIYFLDTILFLKTHILSCFKYFKLGGDTHGSIKP